MLTPSQIETAKSELGQSDLEKRAALFAVLGDKNRSKIFSLLLTHKELCVSDLANIIEVSMSSVSQHLRVLEMSGLVSGERMGQMMCYRPLTDDPDVSAIVALFSQSQSGQGNKKFKNLGGVLKQNFFSK